jgi:ketosteroid isomerase-like protein
MDLSTFDRWLTAYGRAWETGDAQAAGDLFTEDAAYLETPFDEPMRGRAAVMAYWSDVPLTQSDIRFDYEILAVAGDRGIAHWRASFLRAGARMELDGMLTAALDGQDRCCEFREWWHRRAL